MPPVVSSLDMHDLSNFFLLIPLFSLPLDLEMEFERKTLQAGLTFELYANIHGGFYNGRLLSLKNGVLHRVYT
jgi:hypothetical protein